MPCVSHPEQLPDLFLDRSLGRVVVPGILRRAGLRLTTSAERYGAHHDQFVDDIEWLTDAGRRGEAVWMKDARIFRNILERQAVHDAAVRCFCLRDGTLTGPEMSAWFLRNVERMAEACAAPGPFCYIVYGDGIRLVPDRERFTNGKDPREGEPT